MLCTMKNFSKLPAILFATPRRASLGFAVLGAGLIAAGLILQYGFNMQPCHLCWWQRYGHWAMLVLGLLGLCGVLPRKILWGGLLLAILWSGGVGVYHTAVQYHWVAAPAGCSSAQPLSQNPADFMAALKKPNTLVPCDQVARVFGLPISLWNVFAMAFCLMLWGFTQRLLSTRK